MGFEGKDGESLGTGLKVMLAAAFSLFSMVLVIIILHFWIKYLIIRHGQRRRQNNTLYQINTQIAPIDVSAEESPNSGLDPLVLATLPKLLYRQTDQFKFNQGEVIECSVCLGSIVEDATVRVLPNCKHVFHVDCVDKWFSSNTTCPICRTVAEPRVQPTAPPVEVGGDDDDNELEKVGCSSLRIASFHRMISSREDH